MRKGPNYILTGGDIVGRQSLIISGKGSMSMAESEFRELTRVDDKGQLNDVLVGDWELMVRAKATSIIPIVFSIVFISYRRFCIGRVESIPTPSSTVTNNHRYLIIILKTICLAWSYVLSVLKWC